MAAHGRMLAGSIYDRHRIGHRKSPPPAAVVTTATQYASVTAEAAAPSPPLPPPDVSQLVAADLNSAQQTFSEVRPASSSPSS